MKTALRIKRVYEAPAKEDGTRVLVDRIWPRGLSKQQAAIDEWMNEIAPSSALRSWFGPRPAALAGVPQAVFQGAWLKRRPCFASRRSYV